MKAVTLVALTGVVLSAEHSYFRSSIRAPIQTDPSLHKLDHSLLIRRFEDEEFHYKKDFQKIDEEAAKYDPKKRTDYKDDLDEDELEFLQALKNIASQVKLGHRESLQDDELGLMRSLKSGKDGNKPPNSKGRDFIRFEDEELALTRPIFQQRHEMRFDDKEAELSELLKKWLESSQTRGVKGSIKFEDDEFGAMSNHGSKTSSGSRTGHGSKVSGGSKVGDGSKVSGGSHSKAGSKIGAFTSRKLVGLDDEADNSLFDLGGLVKDGLHIYNDVKSHNYGDLVNHGKDAVHHIKNKNHK